jgi:hypothetical protein
VVKGNVSVLLVSRYDLPMIEPGLAFMQLLRRSIRFY